MPLSHGGSLRFAPVIVGWFAFACGGAGTTGPLDRVARERWPETAEPVPLLLALHGGGGNGAGFAASNGLEALADRLGIAVVHADGTGRGLLGDRLRWNAGACCAADGDDVAFLVALVDALAAQRAVDRSKVVLLGHSNGAMMAERALCERPDVFAGAVLVGSPGMGPICTPREARPVVVVHGTADRCATVEPSAVCGGCSERAASAALGVDLPDRGRTLSCEGASPIAERWAALGEADAPIATFEAGPASCRTLGTTPEVTLCTHPGGHAFPGERRPCEGGRRVCDAVDRETGPFVPGVDFGALVARLLGRIGP